jgi:hypothetical protein
MEGNEDEFNIYSNNIFNNDINNYDVLPFGNTLETKENEDFCWDFLNTDYIYELKNNKTTMGGEEILEKLNEFENNYNRIIKTNIIEAPTISKNIFF